MKKITGILLFIIFILPCVNADVIDKNVARIKLYAVDVIRQSEFKTIIEEYDRKTNKPSSLEKRKELLDQIIKKKLLIQAAKAENYKVTESEINAKIATYKQQMKAQGGKNLSDKEIQELLPRLLGLSTWDEFLEEVKNAILLEKYIIAEKGEELSKLSKPSAEDIKDFYRKNQREFVTPEMVTFKQIRILTKGISNSQKEIYRQRAEEIYKDILQGGAFDNYSEVFIKGNSTAIGSIQIETWPIEENSLKITYGEDFFNKVFDMEEGNISEVLESNIGLHIIQVVKKYDFSILKLDDKVPPQNVATVRETIENFLEQLKKLEAIQKISLEIADELTKKADIKIYEENLTW
ncbi:MAG: peptidyl-prolyl cis-trans isomerase [Spirochaetales bacterium]|nr:peptidyl-prolyl cis-trans isomerase [Spirochaetales bacterium]